jgi:uncharacterized repeat protein (TIGR03803 family)
MRLQVTQVKHLTAILAASTAMLLLPTTHAQTVTNLYSFTGSNSSGNPVYGALAQGRNAKLYGTTVGPSGTAGTIFAITTSGKESQLYEFGTDGANPTAGLTLGADGAFYGATYSGGSSGNGVLFKLSAAGVYTDLHSFSGGSDGAAPYGAPVQASDSNFYGTTGGTGATAGASTVYRYEMNGTFSTIYNFDTLHGAYVVGPLVQGSDGNLYGTAPGGGANSCGTIFKISTAGVMLWYYSFTCGNDGAFPYGGLLQASDGNYYGTTLRGGSSTWGVVFKLDQQGNVSTLHTFNYLDGADPFGGLTQGTDGNLYGTTSSGGSSANPAGTLFQINTSGVFKVLYSFGQAGKAPYAPLVQQTNGNFYGTTNGGGQYGYGTVFKLDMGLGPFVSFVRNNGKTGATAQILGQGLTGTTKVTFSGVKATSFRVVSDTYMTAVVPTGATTGPVVITTPSSSLTSNVSFRISQ